MKIVIDTPFTEKELKEEYRQDLEMLKKRYYRFDTKIDAPLENDNEVD